MTPPRDDRGAARGPLVPDIEESSTGPVLVCFSFRRLDLHSDPALGLARAQFPAYALKLLERLKDLGSQQVSELYHASDKTRRFHPVNWAATSRPRGFSQLPSQLQARRAWQFALTANEHGRIFGFLIFNVFYVVWLDPGHVIYPGMTG